MFTNKIQLYILIKYGMKGDEMESSKILVINKGSRHTDESSFITQLYIKWHWAKNSLLNI